MAIYKKSDISPISQQSPQKSQGSGSGEKSDEKPDGEGEGEGDPSDDEDDALDQSIEDKLSQRKDETVDDMKKAAGKGKSGKPNMGGGAPQKLKPTVTASIKAVNWRELIRRFVSSAGPPERTYAKPNSRVATQVSIAQQVGATAVKPGDRTGEGVFKLIIVFDTSGSMSGTIGSALAETAAMLQKNKGTLNPIIGLTFFADNPLYLAADLISDTAWEIASFKDLRKGSPPTKVPLSQALSSAMSGGTRFDSKLAGHLASMASQGYNVIVFSDSDIMYGDNYSNFLSLYRAAGSKLFFIADSDQTFQALIAQMGVYPKTFGHLS